MKRIKFNILLLLLAIALPGYSQLSQKIEDVNMSSAHKYQGKKFLYYNLLSYDGTQSLPPMPFQGDRIRDGKYKASATAMNNYIEEFKKNCGKSYTFVRFFPDPQYVGLTGAVFAGETGDTVYVAYKGISEFFSVELLEAEKKNIGKTIYETDLSSILPSIMDNSYAIPAFFTYSDPKTKELKPSFLPYLSEWTIKDVNYDTTYYGNHDATRDVINTSGNRLYYVIENKKYGSMICYFNENKHTFSKEEAYKKLFNGYYFNELNYSNEDLLLLEKWAKDGTPDMKYYYFTVTEEKSKNKEDVTEALVNFAKEGSLTAAYRLVKNSNFRSKLSCEELSEIIKNVCKPKERFSIYADMYMKMGSHILSWWLDYNFCETKKDVDKAYSVGKEIYKLAEECGADSKKVNEAIEKLEKGYNYLCKEPKFSGTK